MLARVTNVNNLICRSTPLVSYQIPLVLQGPNYVSYNFVDPSGVTKEPCLKHSRLNSWNSLRQVVLYWLKRETEWKTDIILHQDKRYTHSHGNYKKLTIYHSTVTGWTVTWDCGQVLKRRQLHGWVIVDFLRFWSIFLLRNGFL